MAAIPKIDMYPVESVEHLKQLCVRRGGENTEFFLFLAGIARSYKRMRYFPEDDTFWIIHEIDDDADEEVRAEELATKTNFIAHIECGTFIYCDYPEK
jgi:hypothetical protein